MSDPLDIFLPFVGGGSCPVQYECDFGDDYYYVRYRGAYLTVEKNEQCVFDKVLSDNDVDGEWSPDYVTLYLLLISEAARNDSFDTLDVPTKAEGIHHPYYALGHQVEQLFIACKKDHRHDYATCALAASAEERAAAMPKKSSLWLRLISIFRKS